MAWIPPSTRFLGNALPGLNVLRSWKQYACTENGIRDLVCLHDSNRGWARPSRTSLLSSWSPITARPQKGITCGVVQRVVA